MSFIIIIKKKDLFMPGGFMKFLMYALLLMSVVYEVSGMDNNNSEVPLPPENCPVTKITLGDTTKLQQKYGDGRFKRTVSRTQRKTDSGVSYVAIITDSTKKQIITQSGPASLFVALSVLKEQQNQQNT